MEKVYISGKIGEEVISQPTKEKFAKAEKILRGLGYCTFNPTNEWFQEFIRSEQWPTFGFYKCSLMNCLIELALCDCICLLPDWRDSPGAKTELAFAQACGIRVMELTPYGSIAHWNTPTTKE